MRHGDHLQFERGELELAAQRDLGDRHLVGQARLHELAAQHRCGKRRGVDRRPQARPKVGDRAQMILVRVREHDADEVAGALLDEGGIGHDHFDAGHAVVAEGDAEIEHQPLAGMAVEIEVHADLACSAQGKEQELVGGGNGHLLAAPDLEQAERHQVGLDGVEQADLVLEHSRQATRGDHLHRLAVLRLDTLQEAVDQPDIAPEDTRLHGGHRARADDLGRLLDPDARQPGGHQVERFEGQLDARRQHAADEIAVLVRKIERRGAAEIDRYQRSAVFGVAGDDAHKAIGAGILRPLDQHLDAELAVRLADDQQRCLEIDLAEAADVRVHPRHHARHDRAGDRLRIEALQVHELGQPGGIFVGRALGLGAQAELRHDPVAVEHGELRIGVADIDSKQHRSLLL